MLISESMDHLGWEELFNDVGVPILLHTDGEGGPRDTWRHKSVACRAFQSVTKQGGILLDPENQEGCC